MWSILSVVELLRLVETVLSIEPTSLDMTLDVSVVFGRLSLGLSSSLHLSNKTSFSVIAVCFSIYLITNNEFKKKIQKSKNGHLNLKNIKTFSYLNY